VIKTLPDVAALTGTAADRFRREILTAAHLEHANIVPVLAAGEAGGTPYFVMPLVEENHFASVCGAVRFH